MSSSDPIGLAADVVVAFVSNNSLPVGELPALIDSVHTSIVRLVEGPQSAAQQVEEKAPAVSVRKSVTPDYLICLDDGKRFRSLRRHLMTLGMTPEQYRLKWRLPADYPMVAPNYAAQRSALAKKMGLGQMRGRAGARKKGRSPKPAG